MRTPLFSFIPIFFALLMFQEIHAKQGSPVEGSMNLETYSATIIGIWVEHNQFLDGQKGAFIHVAFNTYNSGGKRCSVMANIQYGNNQFLMNHNEEYVNFLGIASIGDSFTPASDNSHYPDYALFIPYDELPVKNIHQITYNVLVSTGDGRIAKSAYEYFY